MATIRLQREDFDAAAEAAALTRGRSDIGAVVTFTGICRGSEAGDPIAALTLEHFAEMAEAEIARHVDEAQKRWALLGVTVIHRYGRITPGENIVLVVTASSHRTDAFAAAEFLMDYLKTRAPFWKQVEGAKSKTWVEAKADDDAAAERWDRPEAGRGWRMIPKSGNRFSDKIMRNQTTRRMFLRLLAGAPLLAAGVRSDAREAVIPRLIKEARVRGRSRSASNSFRGRCSACAIRAIPWSADRARKKFSCCATTLSIASLIAKPCWRRRSPRTIRNMPDVLKRIRYAQGEVRWAERNHDFAQWSRSIVANKICRPVGITPSVALDKSLNGDGLGRRHYEITAVATATLMANQKALQAGDIIGFVSRRAELDFFHTGFIAFNKRGVLVLRHASRSQGRVLDEDMTSFVLPDGREIRHAVAPGRTGGRCRADYAAAALPLGCTSAV